MHVKELCHGRFFWNVSVASGVLESMCSAMCPWEIVEGIRSHCLLISRPHWLHAQISWPVAFAKKNSSTKAQKNKETKLQKYKSIKYTLFGVEISLNCNALCQWWARISGQRLLQARDTPSQPQIQVLSYTEYLKTLLISLSISTGCFFWLVPRFFLYKFYHAE